METITDREVDYRTLISEISGLGDVIVTAQDDDLEFIYPSRETGLSDLEEAHHIFRQSYRSLVKMNDRADVSGQIHVHNLAENGPDEFEISSERAEQIASGSFPSDETLLEFMEDAYGVFEGFRLNGDGVSYHWFKGGPNRSGEMTVELDSPDDYDRIASFIYQTGASPVDYEVGRANSLAAYLEDLGKREL